MKLKSVALVLASVSLATCKTSRSSTKAAITQPTSYLDDGCAALETMPALDGPVCPGEQKALDFYFNLYKSNIKELSEEYDYRVKIFMMSITDLKQQRESAIIQGVDTATIDQKINKVIDTFTQWHLSYSKTTIFLKDTTVRMPTVPAEAFVDQMPGIDQLKFLGCVVPSNVGPNIDPNFAGAMCELSITVDKFRDMVVTREQAIAAGGGEKAESFQTGFRTALENARTEMINFQEVFVSKVESNQSIIENKNFEALNGKSVAYPALVMQPGDLIPQAQDALRRLKETIGLYEGYENKIFDSTQAEGDLNVAIAREKINNADNDSQVKQANLEAKRLQAEIEAKEAEKVRVNDESNKSRARLVTDLNALKNPSIPNDIVNELSPALKAESIQEIPNAQIALTKPATGEDTQILVYSFTSIPKLVVNGVYYRAAKFVENSTNYLKGKEHMAYRSKWYGKSKKEPTTSNNQGTSDILARDYTHNEDRVVAAVARNIRDTMSDPESTVWGRYTDGLDGYVISNSAGASTSRTKTNPWDGVLTSGLTAIGGIAGTFVAPGAGTAVGSSIGNVLGSMLEAGRKKAYTNSKSTSTGVAFSTGYYHILAKYPDLRLGQLVAELGCEVNGQIKFNVKSTVNLSPQGIAEKDPQTPTDVALPELEAPIPSDNPEKYRFPAGNQGALLVKVPAACNNPKIRFVINDFPEGLDATTTNCLTGEDLSAMEPTDSLANVLSKRSRKNCSYMESALLGRVSQVISMDTEIQKAVNLIQELGLHSSTNPSAELKNLAYGSDPYEEVQNYFRQQGNKAGISGAALELVLPIVRNFATGLLNDRKMIDLTQQIADLTAKKKMIDEQKNDLLNKTKLIDEISNLYQGSLTRAQVYNGLLYNRAKLSYSIAVSNLDSLSFWTDTLFESLSYNEYRKQSSTDSLNVESDQKRVRTAIREIYKVILRGETDQRVAELIRVQLAVIENIINFNADIIVLNNNLFTQDIGHCQISLYHLFSNAFPAVTTASGTEALGPYSNQPGGPGQKSKLLVTDDRYGISKTYGVAKGVPYYYLPFDMSALYEIYDGTFQQKAVGSETQPPPAPTDLISARHESFKKGIQCSFPADSMRSNKVPRVLGIAVEFLGNKPSVQNFQTGNLIRLDRSNVMSWYNSQKQAFYRVIDYSSLRSSPLLNKLPFVQSLPEVNVFSSTLTSGSNPCALGAVQTACIQRRLGDVANNSDLQKRGFNFRLLEYNLMLGNKWALVIDNALAKEAFLDSSNVLVHVYWYKSRPVVSIK